MEWTDFLKIYGPLSIGWMVAGYLIKFILDRYQSDIESRAKLASALDGLTRVISDGPGNGRNDSHV